jgi:hypothetical protein
MRTNLLLAFLLLVVSFGVGLARKPQQDTGCCGFAARPGSGTSYESTSQGTDGESGGGHLSELNHQVWFRLTAHQLNSAHGYFARVTGETAPGEANAELFDSEGKLISQARIWFPEALRVFLFDVSPLRNGGAVAGGQAETTEGSTSFLGKTDASGSSASVLRLQTFIPGRVCQGSDDTIWVFGRDP